MDADASMCERRLPALSAARLAADFDRQGCGLRWPDGNEREVRLHVPKPAPCALTFDKCLPFSRLTGQFVRVCGDVYRKDGDADAGSSYPVHQSHWTPVASCSLCPGAVWQA